MRVHSWESKRKKLLQSLAKIDASVAKRAQSIATAWAETAREIDEPQPPVQAPSAEAVKHNVSPPPRSIPADFDYPDIVTAEDAIFQPRPPEQPDVPPEADIPPDLELPENEAAHAATEPATASRQKSLASYLD